MANHSTILLAEDEPNDAFFVRWGFEKAGLSHSIEHVHDGQEALDYLAGQQEFGDRARYPMPNLILLDLKMPRLTGFEVLEWIRKKPEYSDLPIIVFSSSDHENDIEMAKSLGASDYRIKPNEIERFVEMARELDASWLQEEKVA